MTQKIFSKPITIDDVIQKWFPIFGVICIASSLSYLFYDGIWGNISQTGRLALGFLAGIAMIGGGFSFESRLKYFADVFVGGGILLLYVTLIYGSRFESSEAALIPEAAALGVAAIFGFGVAFYSLIRQAKVILGLGILGAYLTPFFIGQTGSFESSISFPEFLLYFAAVNVAVLFVSHKLFLKEISVLNALGLFVGTFTLSLLRGESFSDHLTFSIAFLLFVFAVHTASITINAKKFEKEYDPFLVSSALFPLVWFVSIVKFDLAPAFSSNLTEGTLFLAASAISFAAWYFLRLSAHSDRYYPFYFGGIASLSIGVFSVAQITEQFDGIFLAALSAIFAILYILKPLPQRMATFLGLGISGYFVTQSHVFNLDYSDIGQILFFKAEHAMIILSLLPLLLSFLFPKNIENGLTTFAKITRFFALFIICFLTIVDVINLREIPKDLLFFTLPALAISISLLFEKDPKKMPQKVISSFWLGIFGFVVTFFTMIDRIYPPPTNLFAFQTEEFLIGILSILIFGISLFIIRKKEELFSEGAIFGVTFAFYVALFLTVSHEIILMFNFFPAFIEKAEGIRALFLTLWWVSLAIGMMTMGTHHRRFFSEKNLGFALLIITLLKIFIYDLANVDRNLKALLFLVLGILVLGLSYFSSRKKGSTPEDENPQQ